MGLNKRLIGAGATASGALTPSENFKAVIYTGNGSVGRAVDCGFRPDWIVWKRRDGTSSWSSIDTNRTTSFVNYWNDTAAQDGSANTPYLTITDTGFVTVSNNNTNINGSGVSYVAYFWKANGGTTSSNTDGTNIDSTVQVNSDAGFSIVQFTTPSTFSGSNTVGHGLGVTPNLIIMKSTSTAGENWMVHHTDLGNGGYMRLNTSGASGTSGNLFTGTSSTVFNPADTSAPNISYISYCFANVDGFSKFGSYTGNGSANGTIVETGFEPAFVLGVKTAGDNWWILDNKRNTTNPRNTGLFPNLDSAELTGGYSMDFLSNGFQLKTNDGAMNANGSTYIYMAFAADPDTEAPTLADSFAVQTYTGNGSSQSITGLGFSPSLVWLKDRSSAYSHILVDIIRGRASSILSDNTTAALTSNAGNDFVSFDSDGFTVGPLQQVYTNVNGDNYVAWAWKADDNEPTITQTTTDIDAIAIYKFEDNTNDVTGNFNASSTSNITYNASGKFNKSAEFNGSSSTITLPITTSDLGTGSACSISWWWKPNTSGTTIDFLFEANAADVFMIHTGGGAGSQGLRVGVKNTSETAFQLDVTNAYTTGVWQHHVATFGNGKIKLYENGNLRGSLDYNGTIKTISNIAIGNRPSNSYWYSGELDQVRIYNGELDAASITNLYNETTSQNNTLDIGTDENTSIEAVISANANAGFSIVKWTANGSDATIPHGLSAAPELIIMKNISSGTSSDDWVVGNSESGWTKAMHLNLTNADNASDFYWNDTAPTSTVFTAGAGAGVYQRSGDNFIAYCFHSVSSYSKIGSYTGSGSGNTQSVNLGFQPDWIMIKDYIGGGSWWIEDSVRGSTKSLKANTNNSESTTNYVTEFTSTGFNVTGGLNDNAVNSQFIYMAFKIN